MVARGMTVFHEVGRSPANRLSEREREVLELMASGATNREIAESLHLSRWTVKDYTGGVYRKLGVRNRAESVQRAQRLGLLA
jgi:two-component system response regulator DesR